MRRRWQWVWVSITLSHPSKWSAFRNTKWLRLAASLEGFVIWRKPATLIASSVVTITLSFTFIAWLHNVHLATVPSAQFQSGINAHLASPALGGLFGARPIALNRRPPWV